MQDTTLAAHLQQNHQEHTQMPTSFCQYRTQSVRIALIILYLIMSKNALAGDPKKISIASSIRPLTIIAQDLLGDSAELTTVLPSNASPHHFTLKPSQVRQLEQADIVLAVAPELETFLIRYRKATKHPERHIVLQEVLRKAKAITTSEDHEAEYSNNHMRHHNHNHSYDNSSNKNTQAEDLHLWLNPAHAALLAKAITRKAIKLRPENRTQLEQQLYAYEQKLIEIQTNNRHQLSPYQKVYFGAYHDGYNTFTNAFGLQSAIALTSVPDEQISARKIVRMREALSEAKCLLAESGEATAAKRYARLFKLKPIEIDLLAISPSINTYQDYLRQITQSVTNCLTD